MVLNGFHTRGGKPGVENSLTFGSCGSFVTFVSSRYDITMPLPKPRPGYLAPPVVIILAIITIAVAATLILQAKFFSKDKTPSPTPIAQISPSPSPKDDLSSETLVKEETANWKTYSDSSNSFSVKYPQKFNGQDLRITFNLLTKQPDQTLESFVQDYINGRGSQLYDKNLLVPSVKKDTTVEGKTALWYEGNLGPAAKHIEVYILKESKSVVAIEMYGGDIISDNQRTLLNQILSTFQFTN